jgi:hypothetical protein
LPAKERRPAHCSVPGRGTEPSRGKQTAHRAR